MAKKAPPKFAKAAPKMAMPPPDNDADDAMAALGAKGAMPKAMPYGPPPPSIASGMPRFPRGRGK